MNEIKDYDDDGKNQFRLTNEFILTFYFWWKVMNKVFLVINYLIKKKIFKMIFWMCDYCQIGIFFCMVIHFCFVIDD